MHRVWFINTESVLLSQWIWCYIHHIYYNTWSLQAKQQIPKKWLVTYINISRAIKRTFIFITFFRTIIQSFYIFSSFFQMHHVRWRFAYLLFPYYFLKFLWSIKASHKHRKRYVKSYTFILCCNWWSVV